jgi:hypothetical protein
MPVQTPKSPNPAPSRPDLAGKIAGSFPSSKFGIKIPDPDWAGIGKIFGIPPRFPIWPGLKSVNRDSRLKG